MTEFATATAAVAVMTLGIENDGRVTTGDVDVQITGEGSVLIFGGLAFGKVKWMGVFLLSESKLSSFLAELSSVLEADEIPESGDVGLCWGDVLSVRMYFGARAEIRHDNVNENEPSVLSLN